MKNNIQEFVPHKLAAAMKEIGFDEECLAMYRKDRLYLLGGFVRINSVKKSVIAAPLYQQCFKWFREEHCIHGLIEVDWDKGEGVTGYMVTICTKDVYSDMDLNIFKTYGEARCLLLEKLIEIVKDGRSD